MNRKLTYRLLISIILTINVIVICIYGYKKFNDTIPDNIKIMVNRLESFDFSLPIEAHIDGQDISVLSVPTGRRSTKDIHFNMAKPFTIQSTQKGSYKVDLKLFGFFKIKEINLDVIDDMELVPSGVPIGIYVETNGVLVLGTGAIKGEDGLNYEPALNIIKSGDYITGINGVKINTIEELRKQIQKGAGKDLHISLRRNDNKIKVKVMPIKTPGGEFKIGAWIRDNTQGIGTLTYMTKEHFFGALGHGITDVDTGCLMETNNGGIYKAQVLQILKGETGKPGELVGLINLDEQNKIGDIVINSNQGIFGHLSKWELLGDRKPLPIGLKQDIKLGRASILCQLGKTVEEYEIQIEKISLNTESHSKGLVIRITDRRLLNITNGIVQGMSGSPIIQNDKLIGAVTHVFIQDSTKGYGTFIENMLQNSYVNK